MKKKVSTSKNTSNTNSANRLLDKATGKRLNKRYNALSDQEVLAAAQQGDKEAGIFLTHVRYGQCIANSTHGKISLYTPEDFAQTIAAQVFEECERKGWVNVANCKNGVDKYLGFMAKIMVTNHYKKEVVPQQKLTGFESLADMPVENDLHGEANFQRNKSRMLTFLSNAREGLSDAEKFLLECKFEKKLSNKEIGEILPAEMRPVEFRGFDKPMSEHHVKKYLDETLNKLRCNVEQTLSIAA